MPQAARDEARDAARDAARDGWLGLWRLPGGCDTADRPAHTAGEAVLARPPVAMGRATSWASLDGGWIYRYVDAADPAGVDIAGADEASSLVLLEPLLDVAGASAGGHARWHYVVETDVEPSAQADFDAWYTQEHMPGLAAVPGVARARRYRAWVPRRGLAPASLAPASPRWVAAYDLVEREAFNSPPWLAVRGTAWSSRVRPSFLRTRRTMFARIG